MREETQHQQLIYQIKLLLWKRSIEIRKQKWEIAKYFAPPFLFFILLVLMYNAFSLFYPGGIEDYIVPFATWVFVQKTVVIIMFEKNAKLQESMRIMGLKDTAYWLSYFISDGIVLGFLLSFLCSIISTGGLFNDGNFGEVLGLLFSYFLSVVPFCFFICSFFDTPVISTYSIIARY